ncbi:hypothetical protein GJ496_000428 [Pomphorhynchus laevis]|nr:hypothetical protein GJ496_000428 [Pomphorhynchus laevis]
MIKELPVNMQNEIERWIKWNRNEADRDRIQKLIDNNDKDAMIKAFGNRIRFGTAGLRGQMNVGPANMNDLTIIQVCKGILSIAKKHYEQQRNLYPDKKINLSIVIGYDGRKNSKRFAQLTGTVFVNSGFRIYNFGDRTVPTPMVPFSILMTKSCCGVMITASHNPKDDNGYKLYWSNGVQIISPLDSEIEESIANHLVPCENDWNIESYRTATNVEDIYERAKTMYLNHTFRDLYFQDSEETTISRNSSKITYTAMHGVGYSMIKSIFNAFKLTPVIPVEQQVQPDMEFPTVNFPNPEEGEKVLKLAMETADANDSRIIFANDPDADRLGMAYKYNDTWKVYTGNELGALFAWWIWTNWRKRNPEKDPSKVHMISSVVSSSIIQSMAAKHGFCSHETLTGFKWMGNRAAELIADGQTVLFAFEEAIGFLCGTNVLDKDGISAAAVLAQMINYFEANNKTPEDKLNEIYTFYNLHLCNTFYYISQDQKMTENMFYTLRHFDQGKCCGELTYPDKCGEFKIVRIIDLTTGKDIDMQKPLFPSTPNLPSSASSQMITFYLSNNVKLTLRTSGTEPKIKCYIELKTSKYNESMKCKYKEDMDKLVDSVVKNFYRPAVYGFKSKE